jgi:hypothetical protein
MGVPLRVGLFATILCLYGQSIFTAIPNAKIKEPSLLAPVGELSSEEKMKRF